MQGCKHSEGMSKSETGLWSLGQGSWERVWNGEGWAGSGTQSSNVRELCSLVGDIKFISIIFVIFYYLTVFIHFCSLLPASTAHVTPCQWRGQLSLYAIYISRPLTHFHSFVSNQGRFALCFSSITWSLCFVSFHIHTLYVCHQICVQVRLKCGTFMSV